MICTRKKHFSKLSKTKRRLPEIKNLILQRPNDTKEEANLNAKEKKCCFDNLDNQVEEKTIMPSYRPQPSREKVWVLFQLAAERFTDIS